jgi:hypothetical protein
MMRAAMPSARRKEAAYMRMANANDIRHNGHCPRRR